MSFSSVIKLFFLLSFNFLPSKGTGSFWFVTDFHVDQNYSRTGNPDNLCHEEKQKFPENGYYGNFFCDSPYTLIDATIKSMQSIEPNPDFIIWPGDNLPHTDAFYAEWDVVFEAIKNISDSLVASFPSVKVFPSIGNHDTFPPNILLPNAVTSGIYEDYLQKGGWDKFLSKEAAMTFKQGGFYSEVIKPGLRLISLNTILWYTPNNYTEKFADPANQFSWLNKTLKNCTQLAEKVYIIGHVPPGYYNRVLPNKKSDPTFHLHFLEKYLDILNQYSAIIIGQLYGHYHMDLFQLFQYNTGVFKSSSIIASSVTPWHPIDEYNKYHALLPVNPSIRLMHYSHTDFSLKDYDQYYMDLTKVNNKTDLELTNLFEILYKFTDTYGVPDLSTKSLLQVYETLKKNETVFNTFFKYLTAGKESAICDSDCKVAQLCAMSGTSENEYNLCMNTVVPAANIPEDNVNNNVNINIVITVVITVLIMCLIVVYIVYKKCWKSNYWKSRRETEYERFMSFE